MSDIRKLAEEIAEYLNGHLDMRLEEDRIQRAGDIEWIEARLRSALDQERAQWIKEGPERERISTQSLAAQMRENLRLEEENARLEALPELSQLLGELAVANEELATACSILQRQKLLGKMSLKEARMFAALRASPSDSGRLAGELIRASVKEHIAKKMLIEEIEAKEEPEEGYEQRWMNAREDLRVKADALLSAFPGIAEEVER